MKLLASLPLLFFQGWMMAQADLRFVNHLSRQGLSVEHLTYLGSLPAGDSVSYLKAKYYQQYFNDTLLLENYRRSSTLCNNDNILLKYGSLAMVRKAGTLNRTEWFETLTRSGDAKLSPEIRRLYKASENPRSYNEEDFPDPLRKSFISYRKAFVKKPLVAGALSAVVPGLGKLYAGKPGSAGMAFLLNAAYAAQTIESAERLGWGHAFTIVNAGAFAIFYFANIHGSFNSIKILRKERRLQFLQHASDYYN